MLDKIGGAAMAEKLERYSEEYLAEQHNLIRLLQESTDDPYNEEKRSAVNESLAKMGFVGKPALESGGLPTG